MPRIRVLDNETTGLEPTDKVCELGWTDLVKGPGGWEVQETVSTLCRVEAMPPQARAIHHISAEMTWASEPFIPAAMWLKAVADGVDVIAAHNAAYDLTYWGEPVLPVICTLKSSRQLWPEAPAHGNGVLRYWLQDQGRINPLDALCHPAHRAGPDTYVTAHVLAHMLEHTTAAQLVAWTKLPLLQPRITFGKHKGEWADAPADYLNWILRSDMDADTKWNAERELTRRRAA